MKPVPQVRKIHLIPTGQAASYCNHNDFTDVECGHDDALLKWFEMIQQPMGNTRFLSKTIEIHQQFRTDRNF